MSEIKIPYLNCKRCNHKWIPRSINLPKVCPKCNSPYWNKERGNKMNGPKKKLTKKDSPKEYEEIGELTGSGL